MRKKVQIARFKLIITMEKVKIARFKLIIMREKTSKFKDLNSELWGKIVKILEQTEFREKSPFLLKKSLNYHLIFFYSLEKQASRQNSVCMSIFLNAHIYMKFSKLLPKTSSCGVWGMYVYYQHRLVNSVKFVSANSSASKRIMSFKQISPLCCGTELQENLQTS